MTILLVLSSCVFAGLAILPFEVFNARELWLASVLVTEYGHWLAPLAVLTAAFAWLRAGAPSRLAALIFAASALVFARPSSLVYAEFAHWQRQLRRAFGGTLAESNFVRPDVLRLWFGRPLATVVTPKTLTYAERDGQALNLDLYEAAGEAAAAPWVLIIHGGGWNSGDRRQMTELNSYLAARGFAVISVDYRLAPAHPWPAARDDVRAAIKFVKRSARELRLDPARWVIFGRSAGGQLAEAVAFTAADPTLRGLISLYAPSDMIKAYAWGREDDILGSRGLVRDYLGRAPEDAERIYEDASPLKLVTRAAPPTLQLHGARDPLVWIRHSRRLRDRLDELGVANALIEVPWGTHGFDYNLWGPGGQTLTMTTTRFLQEVVH